jgi:hypothetical protein
MNKLLLIALFYLASCSPVESSKGTENTNSTQDIPAFCIEQVSKEVFEFAKKEYVEKLLRDTLSYKKQNRIITLPLTSNSNARRVFKDSIQGLEDENRKEYSYLGQLKEIDYYLVSVNYWEHFEVLLIDKKSGNSYTVWSVPLLSPNNKFIAAILPYGLEGEPVGIQILSVDKTNYNQINKVIEIDQRTWNPIDFVWENDNSIILKVTAIPDFSKGEKESKEYKFVRLKIR